MWNALVYYWISARGYRWHPWDSPYLQWRFETYLGLEAENLNASRFFQLAWKYRRQMQSFADWAAERRRAQALSRRSV